MAASGSGLPLEARLAVDYGPGGGSRTLVRGTVTVAPGTVRPNPYGFYNLELTGEVRVAGRPYDRFGYRFDVPAGASGPPVPLTLLFERPLRPGRFHLDLQVADLQSGRTGRIEGSLDVPRLDAQSGQPAAGGALGPPGILGLTLQAAAASGPAAAAPAPARAPATAVRLAPPPAIVAGRQRFVAHVGSADVARVAFLLDGKPVMSRSRPPFTVELDLGERPELHRLRVAAFDAAGGLLGSDEVELNAGEGRFLVRLEAPPSAPAATGSFVARVTVEAPRPREVERVELYLDDHLVGALRRPPYEIPVPLQAHEPTLLRAVAWLDDGSSADASQLLNAPLADVVDVDLVELYTAVVDRRGRPVRGLAEGQFRVFEEGSEQRLERFAEVDDLPLHVALVVDTSASMTHRLAAVREAALDFLRQIVTPRDRVTLITFDAAPRVRAGFTGDLDLLANGLEGLKAQNGTALYDSLVFALEQLQGIAGQRVVVLLSDGVDERSAASAADVLELARRSAVTLYTVGLEDHRSEVPTLDRPLLQRLAEESGGRCFFVDGDGELRQAYAAIESEVRSRYLLAYYSSHAGEGDSFRLVDVAVAQPAAEVRTIRGYYP